MRAKTKQTILYDLQTRDKSTETNLSENKIKFNHKQISTSREDNFTLYIRQLTIMFSVSWKIVSKSQTLQQSATRVLSVISEGDMLRTSQMIGNTIVYRLL